MKVIKDDAIANNILELINEFKEDISLKNALKTKDKSWLTDIMLHRYNMSIHMYGLELYYLLISDNEYGKLQIFFDDNLNIKSAYYINDGREYEINKKYLLESEE